MENLNKKSWFSENAKPILIVVGFVVLWIILWILGLIFKRWPLYFILHQFDKNVPYDNNNLTFQNIETNDKIFKEEVAEKDKEINNSVIPFEKKEKCMKYFDKYKDSLKKEQESHDDGLISYISDYEMFYYSELDTCISTFGVNGARIFEDGRHHFYSYHIVDYLNGEKTLRYCGYDQLNGEISNINGRKVLGSMACSDAREKEIKKYRDGNQLE